MMKKTIPVGAMWEGTEKEAPHRTANIWLQERSEFGHEMWRWSCAYPDGSHSAHWSDWNPSYRLCKNELPIDVRMRRIK